MTKENNKITADKGKTFTDKEGNIVGSVLYLGIVDSADNYVEIEIKEVEPKK